MAMSVVYTTFDGEIVHENRGGVASFYAPDTMGSTVALLNSSGVVTDTYSYWPYGETQNHSGSSQTPFGFLGTLGYYLDAAGSFLYVRARYLRQALARWQTADRLWPYEAAYSYVGSCSASRVDPSGMGDCLECGVGIWKYWNPAPQHNCRADYAHCMACCVLTRFYGSDCASNLQAIEHFHNDPVGIITTGPGYRETSCAFGISAATRTHGDVLSGCNAACNERFKPPPGRISGGDCAKGGMKPYPFLPPGCDPLPRILPYMGPNPGNSFSGTPSYDGGVVRHTGGCSGVVMD